LSTPFPIGRYDHFLPFIVLHPDRITAKKKYDSIIRKQPGVLLMEQEQRVAANRGTIFRYCPEFRYIPEDNGTDFRYIGHSGWK
jgi:hypothetical protein